MATKKFFALVLFEVLLLFFCRKDESPNNPPPLFNGLTATLGSNSNVSISGSTRPDTILRQFDPTVVAAVLLPPTLWSAPTAHLFHLKGELS